MASMILKNAFLSWNGKNLSGNVTSVSLTFAKELKDDSAMGDDPRTMLAGLGGWTAQATFHWEAGTDKVETVLAPDAMAGTSRSLKIAANGGTASTSNPTYTGTAFIADLPLVAGSLGDVHTIDVTFQGSGALTRATT